MTRELIMIKPEKALITIRQLSTILIRNIAMINGSEKLGPILTYFKKGQSHMGIVAKTIE